MKFKSYLSFNLARVIFIRPSKLAPVKWVRVPVDGKLGVYKFDDSFMITKFCIFGDVSSNSVTSAFCKPVAPCV